MEDEGKVNIFSKEKFGIKKEELMNGEEFKV